MPRSLLLLTLGAAALLCGAVSSYADSTAPATPADPAALAPTPTPAEDTATYRLYALDVVSFAVHGEGDLTTQLRISGNGTINVPLLGNVRVAGLTLAAAERKLQETYVAEKIFIRPQITLQVREYSKKEISLLGQFARQGKIELPAESSALSIVEAVTAVGGFTRIAKSDSVRVTRKDPETGKEENHTVNVERMISGRSKEDIFYVYPGDVLFVPERLF